MDKSSKKKKDKNAFISIFSNVWLKYLIVGFQSKEKLVWFFGEPLNKCFTKNVDLKTFEARIGKYLNKSALLFFKFS